MGAIKSEEVICRVINYDIGNISENDVKMAIGSRAHIIGFRVKTEGSVTKLAEKENVKITLFNIIYDLIEYIRKEMTDMLESETRRNLLGKIKILAIFKTDSRSQIIGGKIVSGKVARGALAEVFRNNTKLLNGRITQLQHNKEDVDELKEGFQCGLKFEKTVSSEWDIKEGDVLEIYEEEKIARSL